MPKAVNIQVIGNVIELSRDQWKGHVAKITNDPSLLEEVKKYNQRISELGKLSSVAYWDTLLDELHSAPL